MKKGIGFAGALIAAAVLLTSCGAGADKNGWYHDYAKAKKAAEKQNKNMILFVSSVADDEGKSTRLNKDIFTTKEFKDSIAKDYVCVNLDFSQTEYAKSQVGPEASDKEKKAAKAIEDKYSANLRAVTGYNIEATPSLFFTTKEGYLIAVLTSDETVAKLEDFTKNVESKKDDAKKIMDMAAATTKGTDLEKAKAIDVLYEATNPESRFLLGDLIMKFNTLDKKNETGLAGKYTLASANVIAQNAFVDKKYDEVVKAFVDAAQSPLTNADEKQQAYYTAAYTLASTGSTDYETIGKYFQSAYDANPDGPYAPQISQMIEMVKSMKDAAAAQAGQADSQKAEGPQTQEKSGTSAGK